MLAASYRSVLIVPLVGSDRSVGALLLKRRRPGEFPEAEVRLMQTLAAQSVLAIQNAGLFRETEKFNDTERQKWQEFLGTTYDDFISKVGQGRGKEKTYIDSIGQGRVWTGQQGKDRGLVDEYGGLDKAIEVAKQPANIPADKSIQRGILPHPPSFFEQLMNGGGADDADGKVKTKEQEASLGTVPGCMA